IVAARICSLPIKVGAIRSPQTQEVQLSARSRLRGRRTDWSGGRYGHHFRQHLLDDMASGSSALAVALLGALTHQAVSAVMPVRQVAGPGGFVTRFRAVPAAGYATAICVLWILTFIVGSYIYTKYRIYIRIPIEQAGYWKTQGFFDFKEHVA